jgi:hypothetical protein
MMSRTSINCRNILLDWSAKQYLHPAGPANPALYDRVNAVLQNEENTPESMYIALLNETRGVSDAGGKPVGSDGEAFVPFKFLWQTGFDTYRKAKLFLDNNKQIRTRKPSPQRLEVHAVDWFKVLAKQQQHREPTDAEIEQHLAGIEQRKAEAHQKHR